LLNFDAQKLVSAPKSFAPRDENLQFVEESPVQIADATAFQAVDVATLQEEVEHIGEKVPQRNEEGPGDVG